MALPGPRQVGKTTLAQALAGQVDAVYLDLEKPTDKAKLSDAERFLAPYEDPLLSG